MGALDYILLLLIVCGVFFSFKSIRKKGGCGGCKGNCAACHEKKAKKFL